MGQQIDQLHHLVETLESRYGKDDPDFLRLREMLGALADTNERLHLVNEASNDGYFDWDLKSGLAILSPRYYEIIGYRQGEITSDMEFLKRLVHPDDLGPAMSTLERHFQAWQCLGRLGISHSYLLWNSQMDAR
jgi:PAS domain-containing protein